MTARLGVLGRSAAWVRVASPMRAAADAPVLSLLAGGTVLAVIGAATNLGGGVRDWEGLHWTLAALLGLWVAWHGAMRAEGTTRTVRLAAAAAVACWTVGQLIADCEALFGGSFPVPTQAFFLASVIPGTAAIGWAVQQRIPPSEVLAVRIDALTVFAALATVIVGLFGARAVAAGAHGGILILAFPIGFLATAGAGVVTSLAVRARLPSYFCLGGAALIGIAWAAWLPATFAGEPPPGTISGYLFTLGSLAVGIGGGAWRPDPSDNRTYRTLAGNLRDVLPIVAVMVAILAFVDRDPHVEIAVEVGAGIVILLTLFRQSVLVIERGRLVERERTAHRREIEAQGRELEAQRREIAAEASLRELASDRAATAALLARLEPGDDLVATLRAMCEEIAGLSGFDAVGVVAPDAGGRLVPLLTVGDTPAEIASDFDVLRDAVRDDGSWLGALARVGSRRLALVPLRGGAATTAILWASVAGSTSEEWLQSRASLLVEFAALAGTIAGPGLAQRAETLRLRHEIEAVIATRAFRPVYQPIVHLTTGSIVGYEALTRFDDGTAPDIRFEAAAAVGLGTALESAAIRAALAHVPHLEPDEWLSLNVSPATLRAFTPIVAALEGVEHAVVLELTEHTAIDDYGRLRERIGLLGSAVRLAVDDAGSGYASLRHVLELRPAFVKLDLALVRSIDSDPARQGIVAGMCHFAARVGCDIVAEGIETPAELETLRGLGVQLGQGYLLGRPT